MDKKSFILHVDACEIFNDLDDEFAGKLIKAIVGYQMHGEIGAQTDQTIKLLSKSFIQQFKRDDEKYKKVVERNRKNIEKRWGKNKKEDIKIDTSGISGKENHTKKYEEIPSDTKNTYSGNGSGIESKSDLIKENINKNPLASILIDKKERLSCDEISQVDGKDTCENEIEGRAGILTNQAPFKLMATDASKKENRQASGKKKGSRIDPDFILSDELISCAYGAGDKMGINIDIKTIELEFEKFKNYWSAKSGAGACKLDWVKTWTNWIYNLKPVYRTSSGYKPYQGKAQAGAEASQQIRSFVKEQEALTGKKYGIFSN